MGNAGRDRQSSIYRDGATGRKPVVPIGWGDLEHRAERAMSDEAWAYVAGSSGAEETAAANRRALDRWQIVPRVLRDVSERDLSVTPVRPPLPTPLLAAPVGVLELVDKRADLGIAEAASTLGIPYVLSTQASVPMERVAEAMGDAARWYQLYWSSNDELVASLVSRAERIRGAGDRGHAGHADARLAPPRSGCGLSPLHPRPGHRPVHERPGVPAARRRARAQSTTAGRAEAPG